GAGPRGVAGSSAGAARRALPGAARRDRPLPLGRDRPAAHSAAAAHPPPGGARRADRGVAPAPNRHAARVRTARAAARRRSSTMTTGIEWERDIEVAKARSLRERKPILIDVIKDP